jgi:hypothetical protein
MGIDATKVVKVGGFTVGQKQFLDFHWNAVSAPVGPHLASAGAGGGVSAA